MKYRVEKSTIREPFLRPNRQSSSDKLKKSTTPSTSDSPTTQAALNNVTTTNTAPKRQLRRSSIDIMRNVTPHDRSNLYMNMSQINIMLTKMVLIICMLSSCEHIFLLVGHLMFTNYHGPNRLDVIFFAHLSVLLKHSIHILIFYYFNAFFRNRLPRICSKFSFNFQFYS